MSTLKTLGLKSNINSNNHWIDNKIKILEIDITHWTGKGHLKNKENIWSKKILKIILLMAQIKEWLLIYKCYKCGIDSWNDEPIELQLEHINGNHFDNRLENLTLLCPNCHSQTKTFCRKKIIKY
jgi:hypothetical protein